MYSITKIASTITLITLLFFFLWVALGIQSKTVPGFYLFFKQMMKLLTNLYICSMSLFLQLLKNCSVDIKISKLKKKILCTINYSVNYFVHKNDKLYILVAFINTKHIHTYLKLSKNIFKKYIENFF